MTNISARFTDKKLTISSFSRLGLGSICAVLFIMVLCAIVPQLIDLSYAEEEDPYLDPDGGGFSALSLSLSSDDTAHPDVYNISFNRRTNTTQQFGTLGINATVTSESSLDKGFTLTMKSSDYLARLVHADSDLRETNYIASITEPVTVTSLTDSAANPFLARAINHYGYSTDWNGTTGTFRPIPSTQTAILRDKSSHGTTADARITLGMGVNENLMYGRYSGSLEFTAYANGAHNVVDHFRLSIEPGDGTTPTGMPSANDLEFIPSVGSTDDSHRFALADLFETEPTMPTDPETSDTTLYMQDVADWGSTLALEESVQAVDRRDGKLYWVTRLCTDANYKTSGTCSSSEIWMTQNLDFVIPTTGVELKTTDSNVLSDKTLTATNGWGYEDISFYEGDNKYLSNGSGSVTNITCDSTTNGGENCHYHVGNYYSWTAATAGSGTSSVVSVDAPESICPKGWRLPTGGSYTNNYSFGKLTNAYGITNSAYGSRDTALLSSPLWFVRAGGFSGTNLYSRGSTGFFWSSRAFSINNRAYYFEFSYQRIASSDYTFRSPGYTVRCVAEYTPVSSTPSTPSTPTTGVTTHTFRGLNDTPAFYAGDKYYEWNASTAQYEEQTGGQPDITYTAGTWSVNDVTVANTDTEIETVAFTTYEKKLYMVWEQPTWDAAFMTAGVSAQQVKADTYTEENPVYVSYFKMQEMTANVCADVPAGADLTTTLIDTRDAKLYTIIKAKDSNCWMTQNLALDNITSSAKTYYFNTTNMSTTSTSDYSVSLPVSAGWIQVAEVQANETADPPVAYAPARAYVDWTSAYSTTQATSNNSFAYDEYIDKNNTTKTLYGAYYNYHLALGNKSNSGNNTTVNPYSICSRGWQMPSTTDYQGLINSYPSVSFTASPLSFTLSGKIVQQTEDPRTDTVAKTGMLYQGEYGLYWTKNNSTNAADTITSAGDSNTGTSATSANIFIVNASGNPSLGKLHRGNGATVRCLADAKYNYTLHLDGNGGVIPASTMTLVSNIPKEGEGPDNNKTYESMPLSTNSSYIPYRDSWDEKRQNGSIVEYHRHSYTFLGWHTAPVFEQSVADGFTSIDDVQAAMAYPYIGGAFRTKAGVARDQVVMNGTYVKVLYAIWAENDILERVDNPYLSEGDEPTGEDNRRPGDTKTEALNEDKSSKDYADPYGEDTIDDDIPTAVLEVVKLIRKLPDPTLVTLDHEKQIMEVRNAYEALSSEEKAMIGTDLTNKYNAVLTAYYSLLEAESTGSNIFIAALVGAAVSTVAFTIFIIVKKEKEDEEEEIEE